MTAASAYAVACKVLYACHYEHTVWTLCQCLKAISFTRSSRFLFFDQRTHWYLTAHYGTHCERYAEHLRSRLWYCLQLFGSIFLGLPKRTGFCMSPSGHVTWPKLQSTIREDAIASQSDAQVLALGGKIQ